MNRKNYLFVLVAVFMVVPLYAQEDKSLLSGNRWKVSPQAEASFASPLRRLAVAILVLIALLLSPPSAFAEEINVALNRAAWHSSSVDYDHVAQLATDGSLDTFWQSAPENQPWIYVDLGRMVKISSVELDWGATVPTHCYIQVSKEQANPTAWTDIASISCAASQKSTAGFAPVTTRFVRMLAEKTSTPIGCQLDEFIINGEAQARLPPPNLALPPPDEQGKITLDGEGWTIQNTLFVHDSPEEIASASFIAKSWLPATVPGTIYANYLADGAVPDPNFGEQLQLSSESFFQNDFWYRKKFNAPELAAGQHYFLNFDGINWKADIFLNGSQVGHIDGAFFRGKFEVTSKLLPGKLNVLAVLIHKCANPGPTHVTGLKMQTARNGGVLGKDSPTFVASIGWNWMRSVRGRNIGIWDHVSLEQSGPVLLVDPFVHTTVAKDLHRAEVTVEATLKNLESNPVVGSLEGKFGAISFTQSVQLQANETKTIVVDPAAFPQLSLVDPALWWPNGYGEQPLQQLTLTFSPSQGPSIQKKINFGIRQLTYDTSDNVLKISCNGQRIQLNGGNWGMDETMLRYGAKDYDTAVRLHKEMHMTMIRNWVGQTGKEEFFDACDKYGLLVWNDFWLANPGDGNSPDDHALFMANVMDRIARIRNHPSLALYCGRNEGKPPQDLDERMAAETSALDNTRYYISQSAGGGVTGHGPYEPKPDIWYFLNRGKTLHSEAGIVCVPTADSMRMMMPEKDLWPIGDTWYFHDYYQARCRIYSKRIDESYGPSNSLDQFCEKAQMENWENAKAIMEPWRSDSGSGGLMWMSHPAWPSLICQLYDYYLNPTAAYFGVKHALEPLHILWDAASDEVKVANNTGKNFADLHAEAAIYNLDGSQASHQEVNVNSSADGIAADCFQLTIPASVSPVHFIKLTLSQGGQIVSDNVYWHGAPVKPSAKPGDSYENYLALNDLIAVALNGSFTKTEEQGKTRLSIRLENPTSHIALMACVKVVRANASTERVLPIIYDDNYVTLFPHEKKVIHAEFDSSLLEGSQPAVMLQGWNLTPSLLESANAYYFPTTGSARLYSQASPSQITP